MSEELKQPTLEQKVVAYDSVLLLSEHMCFLNCITGNNHRTVGHPVGNKLCET